MTMTNPNTLLETQSYSQESALMSDGTFEQLTNMAAIDGAIDKDNLDEAVEAVQNSEVKYDVNPSNYDLSTGKILKTEAEEISCVERVQYYPTPELLMQISEMLPRRPLNLTYLVGDDGTGQDWVYSPDLQKVYIKMEKTLPIRFAGWDPSIPGLYLRTAMVFTLDQYKSDPVRRCHNHMAMSNLINQNIEPRKIKHVVHCVSHQSEYEERNEHLSMITPLCNLTFEPGLQYVTIGYKFLCKNSCPSGMNRRPTELIFTLEDREGIVHGRQTLFIRICSCPKRDKQKEEADLTPVPRSKKQKMSLSKKTSSKPASLTKSSSFDRHVYKVELNIPGKENYLSVLKYAYDAMAGQAARTGQQEFFKSYMDEILRKTYIP